MQPSEYEIQREVEALRDIRRRSTTQGGPGSLILDPDLPEGSPPPHSQTPYWSATDESSSSSHEDGSEHGSTDAGDDPFHLFWVPARLHPEIAPAEFRAFLKEHARAPSDGPALDRSSSVSSLGRKRSMLSRQYKPSANDGVEEEKVVPVQRKRTSVFVTPGPQLTISDLQKLEELAEEASQSDDPSKLRSVLRRSLSFNLAPSVIDQMDDIPEMGDDADVPIIVPPPGQILRRTQRTKIRKAGQTVDGAHRFHTTRSRRKSVGMRANSADPRSSSDMSSSDHGDSWAHADTDIPEVPSIPRPESYSAEHSIYDAYAGDDTDEPHTPGVESPETVPEVPPLSTSPPPISLPEAAEPVEESSTPTVSLVIHQPQPQRVIQPSSTESISPLLTPSPEPSASISPGSSPGRPHLQEAPPFQPPSPAPSESRREKEKDKKGLFGKWGSDKGGKKGHKEKEKETREREKEKDSSFFGSLFGSKKKPEEAPSQPLGGAHAREAAAALLGASKSSKNYVPPPSPQLAGSFARYPIHVERAIYRLSHIKLANPRRPLYEQVLISNLMFWYLGVINKAQNPTPAANGSPAEAAKESTVKEQSEQKEQEEREKPEERVEQKRRGSLTKPQASGSAAPGARKAETPVRGPQYEMQHRAMEQEYGSGQQAGGGGPPARTSSAPPAPMPSLGGYGRPPAGQSQYSAQVVQPQPQLPNNRFYQNTNNTGPPSGQYNGMVIPATQLPPGAMPPAAVEQIWSATGGASSGSVNRVGSPPRATSPSATPASTPRRARSPPSPSRYTPAQEKQPILPATRSPGRSLSATVAPVTPLGPHVNGKLRKGQSAHAVTPNHRHHSEEEDVPLALWQQQQRRR